MDAIHVIFFKIVVVLTSHRSCNQQATPGLLIKTSILHFRQPLTSIPLPHASACGFLCFSLVFRSFSPYLFFFFRLSSPLYSSIAHFRQPLTLINHHCFFSPSAVFAHTWLCVFYLFFPSLPHSRVWFFSLFRLFGWVVVWFFRIFGVWVLMLWVGG